MAIAIIAFIISLLLLVVAHEFGHFIIARKAGVTVHEFSIGMGPKIMTIGTDKKGTIFNWRLFPIGGYVRIK
ncbi:MAG: site-2 protease family protein [bacterium]